MPAVQSLLLLVRLGCGGAASATTAPPYITVGVDIGNNAHDVIGQNLPFASETNSAAGSTRTVQR